MKRIDLTGKRFGALLVLRPVPRSQNPSGHAGWLVRCDCGNEKIVNAQGLRDGYITSCGCIRKSSSRAKINRDIGRYNGTVISRLKKAINSEPARGISSRPLSGGVECYRADIEVQGKRIYLGSFADYESAVAARRNAEKKYYLPIIRAWEAERDNKKSSQNDE